MWTQWQNKGMLVAVRHTCLYAIEVHDFSNVITEYKEPYVKAVLYARIFLEKLVQLDEQSDIIVVRMLRSNYGRPSTHEARTPQCIVIVICVD